ncbi:MAG TPA: DUF4139 domain-containing protein [Tepidisphaeraceae bacterium]
MTVLPAGGPALPAITGKLLSFDPANIVPAEEDGSVEVLPRGDISSLQLAKLPGGLLTKPTLVWKVMADQAGEHRAQVSYQTDNLTWRADYSAVIAADERAVDLSAWVSIVNESGASYPDAKLKLVAGDVQRVKKPEMRQEVSDSSLFANDKEKKATGFVEKSFFEYHLYTLGRTTSLPDRSTKQVELFTPRTDVPVTKTYVYYGSLIDLGDGDNIYQDPSLGTQSNKKVDVYLTLKNSEANHLGIPLPAGRLRAYKIDPADGHKEFIGEDVIRHTPKDEEVLIRLGSAFDIVGERRQTAFHVDDNGHSMTETFEITLRNHKPQAVKVLVKENLFRAVNWEITECGEKWEKQDHRTIHIPLEVPADGEKKLSYTVKYTW